MRRAGQVVPRNEIIHLVWASNDDTDKNILEVYIHMLRNKLDRDHKVKLIKTVRNSGYAIRDPVKAR
jgi:DNA-binding response OmpR family regulator